MAASWQYLKDQMLMDIDYLPQDFMHMEQAQLQNALTQEITLKSLGNGFWHWVFGGFFSTRAADRCTRLFRPGHERLPIEDHRGLRLLRYAECDGQAHGHGGCRGDDCPCRRLSHHDGAGHRSNIYAQVAKGYRAGGFNIQMFSDILQTELQNKAQTARGDMAIEHSGLDYDNIASTISYKPEESWNYEFGAHLNLFDGKLQADFAGYYLQIRNQQLSVMAGNYGFGRMMVNAGRSNSCGVELSLRGSAFDNRLHWTAGYGFTRAVFKEYIDSVKVDGANVAVDYKDNYVPFVPRHTFSFAADYTIDRLTFGANVAGQGKIFWDEANSYSQKLYATLGAHVDYALGKAVISLWGRNLTATKYNTFAVQSSATGSLHTFAQQANPLQLGVDVRLHF